MSQVEENPEEIPQVDPDLLPTPSEPEEEEGPLTEEDLNHLNHGYSKDGVDTFVKTFTPFVKFFRLGEFFKEQAEKLGPESLLVSSPFMKLALSFEGSDEPIPFSIRRVKFSSSKETKSDGKLVATPPFSITLLSPRAINSYYPLSSDKGNEKPSPYKIILEIVPLDDLKDIYPWLIHMRSVIILKLTQFFQWCSDPISLPPTTETTNSARLKAAKRRRFDDLRRIIGERETHLNMLFDAFHPNNWLGTKAFLALSASVYGGTPLQHQPLRVNYSALNSYLQSIRADTEDNYFHVYQQVKQTCYFNVPRLDTYKRQTMTCKSLFTAYYQKIMQLVLKQGHSAVFSNTVPGDSFTVLPNLVSSFILEGVQQDAPRKELTIALFKALMLGQSVLDRKYMIDHCLPEGIIPNPIHYPDAYVKVQLANPISVYHFLLNYISEKFDQPYSEDRQISYTCSESDIRAIRSSQNPHINMFEALLQPSVSSNHRHQDNKERGEQHHRGKRPVPPINNVKGANGTKSGGGGGKKRKVADADDPPLDPSLKFKHGRTGDPPRNHSHVQCVNCDVLGHNAIRCPKGICTFCNAKLGGTKDPKDRHNPFICAKNPHRGVKPTTT
jgi:hypothetical protein